MDKLNEIITKVDIARADAHEILSSYNESYQSRIITMSSLIKRLNELPLDVKNYFTEAIKCLEHGHKKAAIIMIWAGFFYIFSERLYTEKVNDLKDKREKWKLSSFIEFRESNSESQILDAAKAVGFINNADLRILQGHLSTRNKCAHPTLYQPQLNYVIGYVEELLVQTLGHLND